MTGIIIQARMGSKRFPNKMVMPLSGIPIIDWVVRRVKKVKLADKIILATSNQAENDILVNRAIGYGMDIFRGDENDVLGRFTSAATDFELDTILRVCGDNPLSCPEEIDKLIAFYREVEPDYAFNGVPKMGNRYPDGLGAEITSYRILESLNDKVIDIDEREHVFLHIWRNSGDYMIKTFPAADSIAYTEIRLDVDTPDDLDYLESFDFHIEDSATKIIRKVIHDR